MIDCDTLGTRQDRTPRCPGCGIGAAQEHHRNDVRFALLIRNEDGEAAAKDWIDSLVRSAQTAKKLRDDANAQWKAGNRGLAGDWRQV